LIKALQQKIDATDEASMVEALSGNVTVVEGTSSNFKITTVEDWNMAEKVLS
jgi:2-C-methyl-D-erythritol 4-phosphate cytidylyltransferase